MADRLWPDYEPIGARLGPSRYLMDNGLGLDAHYQLLQQLATHETNYRQNAVFSQLRKTF